MPAPPLGPPPPPRTAANPPFAVIRRGSGTTFTSYDRFLTKADVIHAFALTYHPQSGNQEWGAWIHRYRALVNGVYQYHYWFDAPVTGPDHVPLSQNPGSTSVGWIHTHPHTGGGRAEVFSGADINWSSYFGVPGYLVTLNGRVLRAESISQTFNQNTAIWEHMLYNGSPIVTVIIEDIFAR